VRIIIFSDQHKGARNGADDFAIAAKNYCAALEFYSNENFSFINLGDCEELWENNILTVIKHNKQEFDYEKKFIEQNRYYKIFGNHDLLWDNDPFASTYLKKNDMNKI